MKPSYIWCSQVFFARAGEFIQHSAGKCVPEEKGKMLIIMQQEDKLLFAAHAIVGSRHASTATYRRIRRTVIHMTENFSKNPPVNCR